MSYLQFPMSITWNYTNLCNLRCPHCYSSASLERSDELTLVEKKKFIDELIDNKLLHIDFGGGENLLKNDFMDVLEYSCKSGMDCALTSNGTPITNGLAQTLKKIGIGRVGISIDSSKREIHDMVRGQGVWNKAIEAIQILKKNGIPTDVVTTISKLNYQDIKQIYKLVKNLGAEQWRINFFEVFGRGRENSAMFQLTHKEWEDVYQHLSDIKRSENEIFINLGLEGFCGLTNQIDHSEIARRRYFEDPCGRATCCIRPNGDVTPCTYSDLKAGNIRDDTLKNIWLDSSIFQLLRQNATKINCSSCHLLHEFSR